MPGDKGRKGYQIKFDSDTYDWIEAARKKIGIPRQEWLAKVITDAAAKADRGEK